MPTVFRECLTDVLECAELPLFFVYARYRSKFVLDNETRSIKQALIIVLLAIASKTACPLYHGQHAISINPLVLTKMACNRQARPDVAAGLVGFKRPHARRLHARLYLAL